ncbi:TPA: hypothetical protein L9L20_004905 [Klebsiella pneumoniae]|nr:hypothetical protein [Klebsiella pneumoniae]
MGNYSDFETDFVQRTLALIAQYNEMIKEQGKPFREQYNDTLTLNCPLGLIVLPKERALSYRLTQQLKTSMGLQKSQLPWHLIQRNPISHTHSGSSELYGCSSIQTIASLPGIRRR